LRVTALLETWAEQIGAERVTVDLAERGAQPLDGLDALRQHYTALPPSVREPFFGLRMRAEERLLGQGWLAHLTTPEVPPPYRNHYVLEYYGSGFDEDALQAALSESATAEGCVLEAPIRGLSKPRVSLWRRFYDFVIHDPRE
jgi:hypothetical protein